MISNSTIPVPDSLQMPQKISFTFHFGHKSFILDDVKLAELSNNSFEWKNVTFYGSKHTLTAPTYFQGSRPPTPRIYGPVHRRSCWVRNHLGFPLFSALSTASPDTIMLLIVDYHAVIGGQNPRGSPACVRPWQTDRVKWKSARRRKHCSLAVVRQSQNFLPRCRPPSRCVVIVTSTETAELYCRVV